MLKEIRLINLFQYWKVLSFFCRNFNLCMGCPFKKNRVQCICSSCVTYISLTTFTWLSVSDVNRQGVCAGFQCCPCWPTRQASRSVQPTLPSRSSSPLSHQTCANWTLSYTVWACTNVQHTHTNAHIHTACRVCVWGNPVQTDDWH